MLKYLSVIVFVLEYFLLLQPLYFFCFLFLGPFGSLGSYVCLYCFTLCITMYCTFFINQLMKSSFSHFFSLSNLLLLFLGTSLYSRFLFLALSFIALLLQLAIFISGCKPQPYESVLWG